MEVNGYRQLSGYQHPLKHLILCSKKGRLMQVWNTIRGCKWWQFYIFFSLQYHYCLRPGKQLRY